MTNYKKSIEQEETMSEDQLKIRFVGTKDPKRHLEANIEQLMNDNILQNLKTILGNLLL
jgi:26S proteasome regulatory subunit N11